MWEELEDGNLFKETDNIEGMSEGITINMYESLMNDGWMVSVQSSPLSSKNISKEYGPYSSRSRAKSKAAKLKQKY